MLHKNNFNLIRLVAAFQVLIVHSYNSFEFDFGVLNAIKVVPGVPVFFFISGYLIYQSYERNEKIVKFFTNRIARIFPALWLANIISLAILYASDYLHSVDYTNVELLSWLVGQSTFVQFYNPEFLRGFGVGVVNGSLWTITLELQFYILTPILFLIYTRFNKLFYILIVLSVIAAIYRVYWYNWDDVLFKLFYVTFLPWVYMFMFGALVAANIKLRMFIERSNFYFVMALFVVSMNYVGGSYLDNAQNNINPLSFILLSILVYKLAYLKLPFELNWINRNDISYGVYLYHMPVINLFLYAGILSSASPLGGVICVALASSLLAVFSWYAIESRVLALVRKVDEKRVK
ncbi:acyltransferase family protein [Vibrio hepatarius]|uniref:acyltransferase family protein n=1 Tax=Vibrio hepatarius TaxID=171383 RepID=UPI00142E78B5|nr:acyltransferase [Vibrio hepatarius]NIY83307.1 acyltransferase [Vibrio hepatarius]